MKNILKYLIIGGVSISFQLNAADYGAINLNNEDKTFNPNDIVSGIYDGNSTSLIYANFSSNMDMSDTLGGISVTYGTQSEPIAQGNTYAVSLWNESTANFGSGSSIVIYGNGDDVTSQRGLHVTSDSSFRAVRDLNVAAYGNRSVAIKVSDGSYVDLGVNASVSAEFIALGMTSNTNTSPIIPEFVARESSLSATGVDGNAIDMGGGKVTLYDSDIYGTNSAINVSATGASVSLDTVEINLVGGSAKASTGAVIISKYENSGKAIDTVINFSDGATAFSENGVLYTSVGEHDLDESVIGGVTLNAEGANTHVDGIVKKQDAYINLSISDSATWSSEGSSNMDRLVLDNANIELTLDKLGDAITVGEMQTGGVSDVTVDFSNDFLSQISDGFIFDIDTAIIIGSGEKDNINYIVAESNKDGSTWTVTDNGDGTYTINNINIIPEPATCAVVAGALVFALAAYRRKK